MRVHQNIIIDGVDVGENESRRGSKFMNEGKFDNYIRPHLERINGDREDMTFLEIGCNAGLFLKMAKEMGFRDVIGIESSRNACRIGEIYKGEMDYKIINETIDEYKYDFRKLPVADVVVLSNLHYHLTIPCFVKLLDSLIHKTRYIVIVSVKKRPNKHWRADPNIESVRRYLSEWQEVGAIYPLNTEGDPHPREMFSLMFKSKLVRIPLESMHVKRINDIYSQKCVTDFINHSFDNKDFDVTKRRYFWMIQKIRPWGKEKDTIDFLEDKKRLAQDIKENGMKEPILVHPNNQLWDGGHRYLIMRTLGYKSIISRIV